MSTREDRITRLTERRRADSARKKAAALAAIDNLLRAGQAVTFAAVERSARVSSWFVYNNAEVRATIEAARSRPQQKQPQPPPPHQQACAPTSHWHAQKSDSCETSATDSSSRSGAAWVARWKAATARRSWSRCAI